VPNRRDFLRATGLTGLALGTGLGATPARATTPEHRAVAPDGTTLRTAATAPENAGYQRLRAGPGWPLVVRDELAAADPARDDRRHPLTAFVQFTDLHLVDAQSPARFEYLHPLLSGAFRPHETLGAVAASHLVQRVNALPGGPVTGRAFDFAISTGDNSDNHEDAELDWFLQVLNGGRLSQNTGDPHRYEGVQNAGDPLYWNPEGDVADRYRAAGFPALPGLLDAAIRPFTSPGLRMPWYVTFGNHDDAVAGTLPDELLPGRDRCYTGSHKTIGVDERDARAVAAALRDPHRRDSARSALSEHRGVVREVTPDSHRKPFTTWEFLAAHLDRARTGPGPRGHGFSADNLDANTAYYAFRIAPGITGISLDTTNTNGFSDGSIGLAQHRWLERTLTRSSSRFRGETGRVHRQPVGDELFVVFSHHTSTTMSALWSDARDPAEPRFDGGSVVKLLQRFPNVVAWVNGHTHSNAITPHPADEPEFGFWEVNTASHVDHPQLARSIELVDNRDGTLSLFTALLESDAPYAVDHDDRSPAALASLYRELAFNDPHRNPEHAGELPDRNAELLLRGRSPGD
jgi:metallophosphoesterase (TIGR03767 family)